ncbi:MAG: RNA polymerase-binding transcription factor DksA [Syntrophus sp. PtaB.Bin001]|nr:MAG: RNA polymerase-binding transcription factor DksA [Syntrophus sp. PtaB.Bin001]
MDEIDLAQESEEFFRQVSLRKHYAGKRDNFLGSEESRSPGFHPKGAGPGERRRCIDCGEEIGAARLEAVPKAIRCVECQREKERTGK